MLRQLTLFDDPTKALSDQKRARSGAFVDNMSLPIHRWFRYSAGFSAQWVEEVLATWAIQAGQIVLDPFAGSGTVPVVCDSVGVASVGVEAHPIVVRICKTKLLWAGDPGRVREFAANVLKCARDVSPDISTSGSPSWPWRQASNRRASKSYATGISSGRTANTASL